MPFINPTSGRQWAMNQRCRAVGINGAPGGAFNSTAAAQTQRTPTDRGGKGNFICHGTLLGVGCNRLQSVGAAGW